GGSHGRRAFFPRGDVGDLGPEERVEKRIPPGPLGRRPAQDQYAAQPQPGGGGRGGAGVIRLDAAHREQRVGPFVVGLRGHHVELAHLVAAEREGDRVVALHEQAWPAPQRGAQAGQLLDGRRIREEAGGGQRVQRRDRLGVAHGVLLRIVYFAP